MTFTIVSCTCVGRHGAAAAAAGPVRRVRVRGGAAVHLGRIQLQLSGIPVVPITELIAESLRAELIAERREGAA